MRSALPPALRRPGGLLLALALLAGVVSAGWAAPSGAPWSLDVRPVLLRMDGNPEARWRAHAFGLDVNVHLLRLHAHIGWPGIPVLLPAPVPPAGTR